MRESTSTYRIVIIDDDISFCKILSIYLESWGYIVVGICYNGKDAIELYAQLDKKPDLVITDFHMPNGDGGYVIKRVLQINEGALIIMISGDPKMTEGKAISIGARYFLKKPLNFNFLKSLLESVREHN